jgi:MoaA/NifB/PqqE/SkfB family radical SAM enzyme
MVGAAARRPWMIAPPHRVSMSKTFCALPFRHLCIGPEGTARTCCVSHDFISDQGAPMSLTTSTIDEIWNSAYMRDIRRAMLRGESISACEVCYESEAASGQSYRTHTGLEPVAGHKMDAESVSAFGAGAGYRVATRPSFVKLEVSNLCNLKCRMCYGGASSQIERDPVHSRWSGGVEPLHAIWRGPVARIGPEPRIGVMNSGMSSPEYIGGRMLAWSDGHAIFNLPLESGTKLETLKIALHPSGGRDLRYRIVINGQRVARARVTDTAEPIEIDLRGRFSGPGLVIEILSDTSIESAGGPERGLPLSEIVLHRTFDHDKGAKYLPPRILASGAGPHGPWYMDDAKVFGDTLGSCEGLERLYITGGEPLIQERVRDILEYLVERNAASHIHLELSTNCTTVQPRFIELIKKFKRAELLLSLDAVGETYDYIRHPARWKTVEANVRELKYGHGLVCKVPPVVQVYNILNLVELFRYCDAMEFDITLNILHMPERLAIHHLPPSVRRVAARRLRAYAEADCRELTRSQVVSLADYLDALTAPLNRTLLRELMLFTNDLDATRGQDFQRTHAEFVRLAAEDGFEWTREIRFAEGDTRQRPAKDRDYAWI